MPVVKKKPKSLKRDKSHPVSVVKKNAKTKSLKRDKGLQVPVPPVVKMNARSKLSSNRPNGKSKGMTSRSRSESQRYLSSPLSTSGLDSSSLLATTTYWKNANNCQHGQPESKSSH